MATSVRVSPYWVTLTQGRHAVTITHTHVLKALIELVGPDQVFDQVAEPLNKLDPQTREEGGITD